MSNISFDIAALITLVVISTTNLVQNTKKSLHTKRLIRIIMVLVLTIIADIIAGIACDSDSCIPIWINKLVSSFLFFSEVILAYCFVKYVESYVKNNDSKRKILTFNNLIIVCFSVLLVVNWFNKSIFHITKDNSFEAGQFYYIVYLVCLYFFAYGDYILFKNIKKLSKRESQSMILFTPFVIVGVLFQGVFFPKILIILFMITQAVIIILFLLETPDYQRLNETMEQLAAEKETAYAASKAKSDFLANMSHEIRTPINAVLGMDEMILRCSKESDTREYAMDIKNAAEALLSIINDILDMSKIEEGRMELCLIDYDLSSVINDVCNIVRGRIEAKGQLSILELEV